MDRWNHVPVIPSSNQTLILASERGLANRPPATSLTARRQDAGSDAVLQRVTIVAARPDNTLLYLRADYAAQSPVQAEPSSSATAARDVVPVSRQASNRGIELYASTQRPRAETSGTRIDVQA
jgi:hypothetical protein